MTNKFSAGAQRFKSGQAIMGLLTVLLEYHAESILISYKAPALKL